MSQVAGQRPGERSGPVAAPIWDNISTVDAARIVRQARARAGLSQRDLARLSGIPQPMISAIERGLQDPRHGTLERLLDACGQELDLVLKMGEGVDPTQFIPPLGLALRQRLRVAVEGSKNVERFARQFRASRAGRSDGGH